MTIYKTFYGTNASALWVAGQITKVQAMEDDTGFVPDLRTDEGFISGTTEYDPELWWLPGGTPTNRIDLSGTVTINKQIILPDGVDSALIQNIPLSTTASFERIDSVEDTWIEIPNTIIYDGSISFTSLVQMNMRITLYKDISWTSLIYDIEVTE